MEEAGLSVFIDLASILLSCWAIAGVILFLSGALAGRIWRKKISPKILFALRLLLPVLLYFALVPVIPGLTGIYSFHGEFVVQFSQVNLLSTAIFAGQAGVLGLKSGFFGKIGEGMFEFQFARQIAFRNQRSVANLVVVLAVVSISLGVAVMEVSMAIVYGFKTEIQNKIVGFGSHIQIGNYLGDLDSAIPKLPKDNEFVPQIDTMSEVASVAPFMYLPAMIKTDETLEGVVMKGVDPGYDWTFFRNALKEGELPKVDGDQESREILISRKLSDLLLIEPGDEAIIYFFRDKPRVRKATISGIYETGLAEFDEINVLCDMRMLQRIVKFEENDVMGFEVNLHSLDNLVQVQEAINFILPIQYEAKTIVEKHPELFDWLELQHQNVWFIIVMMVIIAVINMISVILIMIIERTRTIGLLKAMGLSNARVKRVFIYNALFLIVIGIFLGNLLGFALIGSQDLWGWVSVNQENYFVTTVPVKWVWDRFIAINIAVVGVCLLWMFLPTLLVTRISPVKAIRFD